RVPRKTVGSVRSSRCWGIFLWRTVWPARLWWVLLTQFSNTRILPIPPPSCLAPGKREACCHETYPVLPPETRQDSYYLHTLFAIETKDVNHCRRTAARAICQVDLENDSRTPGGRGAQNEELHPTAASVRFS
ncbi:unnamed protein product, partial [Sphacelaria rigidula]